MKLIDRRIAKLATAFAPLADRNTVWGKMAPFRDELLRGAEQRGELAVTQLKEVLDRVGPLGLWIEALRCHLREHGFVQSGHESLAQTVARALRMDIEELKACMACEVRKAGRRARRCRPGVIGQSAFASGHVLSGNPSAIRGERGRGSLRVDAGRSRARFAKARVSCKSRASYHLPTATTCLSRADDLRNSVERDNRARSHVVLRHK
jgi:hypothetical protein